MRTRVFRVRLLAGVATGLLLISCSGTSTEGPTRGTDGRYPYWEKGAGAREAAAFMGVAVPEGATEVKGAVRVQPQEKVYLLSFLTDAGAADAMVDDLRPEGPLRARDRSSSLSGDGFRHLGLASPQDVEGVRTATACPPCVGDPRRRNVQAVEIHVGADPRGRTRVYLTAY
ncbi:hypothetical protein [Streptomyces sp. NPDC015131]|uniref:hypothetical protein n=1 Tax=Streptomyces sp. NPDC015131 TaxID=3364941 RepID=UPI0036F66786